MYSNKKTDVDIPGFWHVGIVFQGIIVALTVFLGRVYVLTYHEALGIPIYESQLSAIDYAIVSPGVTVIGIGLSITLGSYFLLEGPLRRLQLPKPYKFGLWLFLTVTWPVVLIVSGTIEIDAVIRSLCIVLSMAMSLYGGAMLGSTLHAKFMLDALESEQKQVEMKASMKLLSGVLSMVLVIIYGWYAYNFSSSTARDEAMDALHQSPQATVQFESGESGSFGVIMVGEQFVYLLPEGNEELQAFPHNSIVRVEYANRPESYAQ